MAEKTDISNTKCLSIDDAAEIFKQAASNCTTFDDEQDKVDWLLDLVNEFKKIANYDKHNSTSSRDIQSKD